MPTKSKSTARNPKVKDLPQKGKSASGKVAKDVKGGQKLFQPANFNFKTGGLP